MTQEFTIMHVYCGLGGAALGAQQAISEYKGMVGKFRTLCGIDCDPEACADFEMLTGAPAVHMDLFSRDDYIKSLDTVNKEIETIALEEIFKSET